MALFTTSWLSGFTWASLTEQSGTGVVQRELAALLDAGLLLMTKRGNQKHFQANAAARCELFAWRATAEGCLAEIVVLDQFSRNIYRDTPRAFAQDALALALAQALVASGQHLGLSVFQRRFAYMPYMHSESPVIHAEAAKLFAQPGLENALDFELRHQAIITRFGRYPHRNQILRRVSTAEEIAFFNEPGSSF